VEVGEIDPVPLVVAGVALRRRGPFGRRAQPERVGCQKSAWPMSCSDDQVGRS